MNASAAPDVEDTIVAQSSAAGPGARAIVRLSGRRAAAVVRTLLAEGSPLPVRRRIAAALLLPPLASPLPADLYFFPAPASFTAQDVVEIHMLSSPPLVELLIQSLLAAGARAARPGEFTLRAFLAGKLDLTRAEAVAAVIDAEQHDDLRQALAQLAGGIAQPMQALRSDLLDLLADIEAGLDFADEDLQFVQPDVLLRRLGKAMAMLTLLRKQIEGRGLTRGRFRVALAGPPNAGKSSLFNALLGSEAALVSAVPGTTRDYLQAVFVCEGVEIELIDTAGLHGPQDELDASAQARGRAEAEAAGLILWCEPANASRTAMPSDFPATKVLRIATKADLGEKTDAPFATSAVTRAGLQELRQEFARRARARTSPLAPSLSRCKHHVDACLESLRRAHAWALDEQPAELLALDLRLALEELGALAGAVYTDDLLDRIFSRFCIGK